MREVVIVDGIRVRIGKAGKDKGYYKDIRGDDLGALCIRRLLEKNPKVDPKEIEDVVWGCANQTGEQGLNVGRMIGLLAGLPVEVAGARLGGQFGAGVPAGVYLDAGKKEQGGGRVSSTAVPGLAAVTSSALG